MVKDSGKSIKQSNGSKPKKDIIPKTVAGIFRGCLDTSPEKRALVEEMGFGVLSNLPNYYLKQKVLKELFNRFDIYDNTIHAVAGEMEITTKKIGDALGLSSTGTLFPYKVVLKELSEEDFAVYKFFQGKTQAQLGRLIMDTPVDTTFLLATSSANVTPRAYPTFYDVENTKQRNWVLHVHNFLLEELKKAKENKTKSIHGCCYALLIIYFHETKLGKNSREPIAQSPWIDYWNGRTLWDRMKQEKRDAAGLVRTGKLRAQKEKKQKKSKKSPSPESEWESESETDTEGYVPDESEKDTDFEDIRSDELVQRKSRPEPNPAQEERRSKKRHESNDAIEAHSGSDHEPPQQPRQLEEEETPIQQPEPQPQQQPPQDDVIDISSCSDDE
ncbi:hypothetical protein PIB30_068239 [Stylosanthes scabra]|uniref:Uncharacterized protein n=1 Tax=Stylosanthes scabra TaxID=79078 RepID=A0ABU6RMS3_9FABA|nr:hypothetical protein [Stylosanthes scabra]